MSEIHKLVCDVCGKEKDLLAHYFDIVDKWQSLHINDDKSFVVPHKVTRHVCSTDCAIKLLQDNKDRFIGEVKND